MIDFYFIIPTRYRAGPQIGFVVENLDEVNARSVPKPEQEDGSSIIISAARRKTDVVSTPLNAQHFSPLSVSGVLPPKTSLIPPPNTMYSAPSNTHEIIR